MINTGISTTALYIHVLQNHALKVKQDLREKQCWGRLLKTYGTLQPKTGNRNKSNKNTAWLNLHLAHVCPKQVKFVFDSLQIGLAFLPLCVAEGICFLQRSSSELHLAQRVALFIHLCREKCFVASSSVTCCFAGQVHMLGSILVLEAMISHSSY